MLSSAMLFSVILSIHVLACVLVIFAVLMQSGKGAGFSGIFGGGGSDAVFSAPSGSNFFRKVTSGLAIAFFVSSLLLTYLGSRKGIQTVTRQISYPVTTTTATSAPSEESKSPPAPVKEKATVPPKK